VLNRAGDGALSSLNGFVHGSSKPELRQPLRIEAHLQQGARLVMHLNSVSSDPILVVRQNGRELLRRALPNKDGGWERNNEYNEDIAVPLQSGRSVIEVENAGADWAFFDWARLEGVLPAQVATGAVPLEARALTNGRTTLLWALDPSAVWPRGTQAPPSVVSGARASLPNSRPVSTISSGGTWRRASPPAHRGCVSPLLQEKPSRCRSRLSPARSPLAS
jgi:hypothetical protein